MADRHQKVVTRRMQVGIMKVGGLTPPIERAVSNVAVSVGANLCHAKFDVIAGSRRFRHLWRCLRLSGSNLHQEKPEGQGATCDVSERRNTWHLSPHVAKTRRPA